MLLVHFHVLFVCLRCSDCFHLLPSPFLCYFVSSFSFHMFCSFSFPESHRSKLRSSSSSPDPHSFLAVLVFFFLVSLYFMTLPSAFVFLLFCLISVP
ncbi:hypothetical protein M758_UG245400 [Ceratodon purpureus]|nr:hypothetical protein M758_UG245400 [Ceratodon purpureus]